MKKEPRQEVIEFLHHNRFRRFINGRMWPIIEKGYCKWCGSKLTDGRRSWCSGDCSVEGMVRYGYILRYIYDRDKGVCLRH
jgi:hypothetical protein